MRATHLLLLLATLGGLGSLGCRYDAATDGCYAVAEAVGARLVACGHVSTQAEGEQVFLDDLAADGLDCDTSPIGLRDEDELYDECIPQIGEIDCVTFETPAPCVEQILYRGR